MLDAFRYCPTCQHRLNQRGNRVNCSQCGFEHYDNPAPTTAMVFYHGHEVLLVERGQAPAKGKWDVPGGFINLNETAEEGMCRELKEELGVVIQPGELEYLGSLQDVYAEKGTRCLWSVFAYELDPTLKLTPTDDVASVKWFSLAAIPPDLVFNGVKWSLELFRKKQGSLIQ